MDNWIELILALLVCALVVFIVEKWLKKKFNIPKSEGFFNEPVNKVHKWLEILLLIGFIIGYARTESILYMFFYFIGLYLIRSFMQWRYQREQKEYILQIFGLGIFLITMLIFKIMFI